MPLLNEDNTEDAVRHPTVELMIDVKIEMLLFRTTVEILMSYIQ